MVIRPQKSYKLQYHRYPLVGNELGLNESWRADCLLIFKRFVVVVFCMYTWQLRRFLKSLNEALLLENSHSFLVVSVYPENLASSISETWPRGSEEAQDAHQAMYKASSPRRPAELTQPASPCLPRANGRSVICDRTYRVSSGCVRTWKLVRRGVVPATWAENELQQRELLFARAQTSMRTYLAIYDVIILAQKSTRYFLFVAEQEQGQK